MKINFKKNTNVVEFSDIRIGEVFSYDDYSGLFLKIDDAEAFDFEMEASVGFRFDEKVIRRKISITIEDALPYQD